MRDACSFRYRGSMAGSARALVVAGLVGAALLAPTPAHADGIFSAFAGGSFGTGDQDQKVSTWGLSLAGMAGGVFGVELDFARTGNAAGDETFVQDSRVTNVFGNIIIGVPIKAVRPDVVGGLGWVRTEIEGTEIEPPQAPVMAKSDGLGLAVGGGLMGFFTDHVGARVDLRYIRSITVGGDSIFDFTFEKLSYWRASGGVALRF